MADDYVHGKGAYRGRTIKFEMLKIEVLSMDFSDIGFVTRGTLAQLLIAALIPFLWWLFRHRRSQSFFKFVGLKAPELCASPLHTVVAIGLYWVVWFLLHFLNSAKGSTFHGMGVAAIVPALIMCFFQNGLAEELLFRGFLLKRFDAKMNFLAANISQAALFALLHVAMLALGTPSAPLPTLIYTFVQPFAGGLMLGYASEKLFRGSIIPSVILHGTGNYILRILDAFLLL